MREPKKIKYLRFARTPSSPIAISKSSKLDQPGLLLVQAQSKLCQAILERFQETFPIASVLETQYTIVEISKSEGKMLVKFNEDRGLLITDSTTNLIKYIEAFKFSADEDGNHHHPEFELVNENNFSMGGLWPFIEADSDYVAVYQEFAS